MANHGWFAWLCPAIAGHGQPWLAVACHERPSLANELPGPAMTGHGHQHCLAHAPYLAHENRPAKAGHGWPGRAMAGHGWPWQAMADNGWAWLAIAGHALPWPAMADHGRQWLAVAVHGWQSPILVCLRKIRYNIRNKIRCKVSYKVRY